jgi:hypothetical protein
MVSVDTTFHLPISNSSVSNTWYTWKTGSVNSRLMPSIPAVQSLLLQFQYSKIIPTIPLLNQCQETYYPPLKHVIYACAMGRNKHLYLCVWYFIIPVLADFSFNLRKKECGTPAIFLLHLGLHPPLLQLGRAKQSTIKKRGNGSKTESDWSESGENILEEVEIRSRPVHNTTVAVFLSKRGLMSV